MRQIIKNQSMTGGLWPIIYWFKVCIIYILYLYHRSSINLFSRDVAIFKTGIYTVDVYLSKMFGWIYIWHLNISDIFKSIFLSTAKIHPKLSKIHPFYARYIHYTFFSNIFKLIFNNGFILFVSVCC